MAFQSDKRLYLTSDGQVVEEGDERAATLLVGEGGQLSDADAAKYGLNGKAPDAPKSADVAAPQSESKQRAQATKAVSAPEGNK
jgi:hypothetical protein